MRYTAIKCDGFIFLSVRLQLFQESIGYPHDVSFWQEYFCRKAQVPHGSQDWIGVTGKSVIWLICISPPFEGSAIHLGLVAFYPIALVLIISPFLLQCFLSTTAFGQGVFLLTLLEGQELGKMVC